MGAAYAKTMFGEAAKRLQGQYGSRAQYERMAERGEIDEALGPFEREFIAARDSFYVASVTESGWPYMQHRGGPKGFLRMLDGRTLAFADFAGNKQYITAGNLETDDRVAYAPEDAQPGAFSDAAGPAADPTSVNNLPGWGFWYQIDARVAENDIPAWQAQGKGQDLLRSAMRACSKTGFGWRSTKNRGRFRS